MAITSKRLAGASLVAATETLIYEAPASKHAAFKAFVCNQHATNVAAIRVAVTSGGAPAAADFIRYDQDLPPQDSLDISNLGLTDGQRLYVESDVANVSVVLVGIEEDLVV